MHTTPSDTIAADAARRRARIAALGEIITRMTERLRVLQAERTQLILQVARAEQVLDWRARAGVALGDVYADLEALDVVGSHLVGADTAGDLLMLTFKLRDLSRVRIVFTPAPSASNIDVLRGYAANATASYQLLLIAGGELLSEATTLAGDLLAVQRLDAASD